MKGRPVTPTSVRSALVIGGGIAGPATAMALQKAGIDAVVYEAHPTGADHVGLFLTLASNGIDALRVLGADDAALAAGFPTPRITLRSGSGKHLGDTRIGLSLPDVTTSQTMRRADLYRGLHEEALVRGVRVEHDKRLVAAEETGEGVRAVFADGSEAVGDVLIGCDGVHSTVRRIIDPCAPAPTYVGLLNSGGFARGVEVDAEPGRFELIFGRRAFFGYTPAPDGEVWWFANVPRRDEPARGDAEATGWEGGLGAGAGLCAAKTATRLPKTAAGTIHSGEELRSCLVRLYAEDAGPAVALIQATPEIPPLGPIHSIPHLPKWHSGRMTVVGDAAHAPSPTSGQGASLSIEDALVLAKCLRDLPSPQAAFARFEAVRRPRVERIIRRAARVNNSKTAGPVARMFRDALLPLILKMTADSRADEQTFGYHIDWDAPTPAPV